MGERNQGKLGKKGLGNLGSGILGVHKNLGHLQRATRYTKRETETQFYLHFCRVLVSRVKRRKGDWVKGTKGNWEKRVLGTWVL